MQSTGELKKRRGGKLSSSPTMYGKGKDLDCKSTEIGGRNMRGIYARSLRRDRNISFEGWGGGPKSLKQQRPEIGQLLEESLHQYLGERSQRC